MPLLGEYLGLISAWHSDKPKFMSTVAALAQPFVDAQAMLYSLTEAFDLDTAVGVQLDMVGQWIGRSRYLRGEITGVFFSFDLPEDRVGFDQGVWAGPYDELYGLVRMDDETYRDVLKLQAIANSWDGTIASIYEPLNRVFPGIAIDDRGDRVDGLMEMEVLIPGALVSSLLLRALEQVFPVKPSGVRVNFIETTVLTQPIFGFDIPASPGGPFGGFDEGAWGIISFTP